MPAAFLAGPPVTTYSEVTSTMSITKITNAMVIRIAAGTVIVFSAIGKMLLLFGTIVSMCIQNQIQHHVDLNKTGNILILSITLNTDIGGIAFTYGVLL